MRLFSRLVSHSFLFVVLASKAFSQDLTFSPATILFSQPVYTTSKDSASITMRNTSCGYLKINYIYSPSVEFKIIDTTGFLLAPQATKSLKIYFTPRQNIEYNSALIMHSSSGDFALPVKGYGKFIEAYYDGTYNKFDENLKASLNSILATNYQSYSYTAARDKMFMEFDNKKTNGQGALQNTLECIYTGRLAVGYTSRTDCQTNNSFNTEHTWPQSLFGSATPMVSDLNHLFPTDDAANNYRSNSPFSMVSSPVWTVGGSKGISSSFEPRDAQKGRTARAMLYFAIRYNNPSYGLISFFGPQEAILRTWCLQFLPDSIDRKRNEDIFGYQKNRNPFIDHPEFLERITSIANTSIAPVKILSWCDTQTVSKNYFNFDSLNYSVTIFNTGNTNITCSKIQSTQNLFNVTYTGSTVASNSSLEISITQYLTNSNTLIDTLLIENNSTNHPVIKIPIRIQSSTLKISTSKTTILTSNDSAILTIPTSGTVSWNTGASGNKLITKNGGSFYATVTDSAGCHRTDTVTITKSGTGINPSQQAAFVVFPNPASEKISILNTTNALATYFMINSLGGVIESFHSNANQTILLDVRGYANGIYLLQDNDGRGCKILIQK